MQCITMWCSAVSWNHQCSASKDSALTQPGHHHPTLQEPSHNHCFLSHHNIIFWDKCHTLTHSNTSMSVMFSRYCCSWLWCTVLCFAHCCCAVLYYAACGQSANMLCKHQAQTLPDAAPPTGKVHPLEKWRNSITNNAILMPFQI